MIPDKRLFWFLRDGVQLDLSEPSAADLYVQQVLSRGRADDVKQLFARLNRAKFLASFRRVERFLPVDVRQFWEDCLGDH